MAETKDAEKPAKPKKAAAKPKSTAKTTAKVATKAAAAKKTTAGTKKTATAKPAAKKSKAAATPEQRYRMIEVAAYYLAEKDSFSGNPVDYWIAAELQFSK